MADTEQAKEPIDRAVDYFSRFRRTHLRDYFEAMRDFRVWPEGGYPNFYKDSEVVQCMVNIYMNLEENFGDMRRPEGYPSDEALVRAWTAFRDFLVAYEGLFQEIKQHVEGEEDVKEIGYPIVLVGVDRIRHEVIDALVATLRLYERWASNPSLVAEPTTLSEKVHTEKWKSRTPGAQFDVVIITALHSPEFTELKRLVRGLAPFKTNDPSRTIYKTGHLTAKRKRLKVLIVCSNQMGMPAAATLATKLIYLYAPKLVAMCGICAGIKGQIGDILVPDILWDYGSGKRSIDVRKKQGQEDLSEKFAPYRHPESISNLLIRDVIELSDDGAYLGEIQKAFPVSERWKGFPSKLSVRVGPYASGAAVVANERVLDEIKAQDGKLIGFDMEAYGVVYACNNCSTSHRPLCLIVKSISDYGDSKKGSKLKDAHQKYAAHTSARYLVRLIENEISLN